MTNNEGESPRITVIDYQAGNVRSVEKAVVFPGQGSCDSSMVNLRTQGMD